ncbi:hypothetical protein [Undibacterium sp. Ji49W]|uniref:hypothetical protein n=1 Tax=Undibacterium sp. Ji49W TaxID=3413040 RepID=UPI003BF421B4
MSQICHVVTTWITTNVTEPVENWVSQQQKQCKKWPWPLNWICQMVMVLVKVIVWITKAVTTVVTTIVCTVITLVIGIILWIFSTLIDAFCQKCNATAWVKYWFLTLGKIKYISQAPSRTVPGSVDYVFDCGCKRDGGPRITVTATTDDDAAVKAKEACNKLC